MKNNWILDVLADLKTFAQANGMVALAEQLDDTALIAAADLALIKEGTGADESAQSASAGVYIKGVGTGIRA